MKNKKLVTHEKMSRQKIRRTVDALTRITTADPIAFLTEVMKGKSFLASSPKNPTKQIRIYPSREQRILVAMYLASRIIPAAKTSSPAAGDVNVIIRSRHSNEGQPQNLPARFSKETNRMEIIDATPSQEPTPPTVNRARAHHTEDGGTETEIQISRHQKEPQEAQVSSSQPYDDED